MSARSRATSLAKHQCELLALRRRLAERLTHPAGVDVAAAPNGHEDYMEAVVSSAERDFARELNDVFTASIQEVDDALLRLAQGTYGVCERCGHRICPARLSAMPSACLCIRCKKQEEA
jgi:DnaK suppressor protein